MPNNRKTVDFETKILHEGKVFLKASDASKALNICMIKSSLIWT